MKKRIFSFFLATVMVVAMVPATLLAVFAEETTNDAGYNVAHTNTAIELDGAVDQAYLNSDKVEIKNLVVGESSETNGYAYMAYDKDYLYIAVYVSDSTDDGANDYVALTIDWLYDAELFATGASNYKKPAHWTAPSLYLGYSQAGRVLGNSGNTWHAWMFPGGIKPEVAYAAVENSTDYIVEWKIEWKGSAKTELLNADSFDFGAGIIIYDNGVEISSSEQTNTTNKAFTGAMLPKFNIVNDSEAMYYTDVAYSSTSLVIDGEIDDKYRESTPIKIDQYVGGEGKNDLGNSVAYAAFTDDYLYVIIDVVDSTIFANGYYGSTADGNVHEGAEIVVDFFRATATAEQMALDSAAYKTAAVNAKAAGYFRTAYKHNTESNKYGVYSWYNSWMFAEFNTVKTSAVKILEDGTGYRLEYRFAFDDATKAKIATGESCEIGLGFVLRDDTQDDGVCYRYSVYKSCSPTNIASDPKGVTSYVVTKPAGQATEPDQPNPDQPNPDQPNPDQPNPDQPTPTPTQPKISYSLITPLVDGELDDLYLGSTPIAINQYVGGEGQNDLGKSVAYAVISGNALYLLIDVKDSTVFADGYNGRASDDSVQEGAEVMIDFFRGSATEEQLALSGANYKKVAAEAGEIGYFKSTYKHNVDKNNYNALSFYNCWMYGDFATSGLGGAKVKILEDGTGYRLEYRLVLPESISSKISEMENGDSFEMGLGILLRDDTTDDGEVYRHSVYKSGSVATNDILATPSFTFVKEIPEITGANVSLGEDISVNYYVDGIAASMKPQMRFTMNGKKTTIDGVYNEELSKWCFKFENVAPQCMGDNIKAELLIENMVVASQYKYSVLENVTSEDVMNDENKQLVYDLLAYGAAAQIYIDHNADTLVNEGYEELATQVTAIENGDRVIDAALSDAQFTAAGVYHDSVNKLYVKLTADDITGVTVAVNGEAAEIKELDDGYIVYTNNIKATDFDEVYTFVLTTANGSQTLTYSVNAYAKAKCDSENAATAALAKALYAYGCSAEQYQG